MDKEVKLNLASSHYMKIFNKDDLDNAIGYLKIGKIIVFPTETSYGLGCDATNQEAVEKIYKIKKRDPNKPLLVIVPTVAEAKKYLTWNSLLDKLAKKYWPGPLTIVSKCSQNNLSKGVISESGEIAIRVTNHPVAKRLAQGIDLPVVATSANISDTGDMYDISGIIQMFEREEDRPDAVIDFGILPKVKPTTLVRVIGDTIEILRQGELKIDDSN